MIRIITHLLVVTLLFAQTAWALPEYDQVISGDVEFTQADPTTLQIQASDNSIIHYNSFNIAEHETVEFILPNIHASTLNRVLDQSPSQILGTLLANGNVILINETGFFIGETANIQAAGFIASTLNISNQDFQAGRFIFRRDEFEKQFSAIINEGTIRSKEGGFIALIGSAVKNVGEIIAPLGTASLAVGDVVTVGIGVDNLISIAIDKPLSGRVLDHEGNEMNSPLSNEGLLQAAGGAIILKSETVSDLYHQAINLDGIVRADHVVKKDGIIEIVSSERLKAKGDLVGGDISIVAEGHNTLGDVIASGNLTLDAHSNQAQYTFQNAAAITVGDSLNIKEPVLIRGNDAQFTVARNWNNQGHFDGEQSVVTLVGTERSRVMGDNNFYDFLVNAPGKKIDFEAGKVQTTSGRFHIEGRKGELIELRSTDPGATQWMLNPLGEVSVRYVHLGDAHNISDVKIKALPSNSFGNNTGWDTDPIWDGGGSTNDWSENNNWDTGVAPGASDTVTFNGTSTKDSSVDVVFSGVIRNLNINAGYTGTLTVARPLQVTRDMKVNAGTVNLGNQSLRVDRNYSQTGGTFNGNTGSLDFNRDFIVSGGTFNAPSFFFLARNFTHTAGGIFNAGTGTVEFDAGGGTINVNSTESFYRVIFDSTGTKKLASGDRIVVANQLILEDGKLNTGTLEAQGNVDIESEFTGGSTQLEFTGASSQTFDLTGAEAKFDGHITVNKTSGTATLASDLTMNKSGQDLYIQSGTFDLGNQTVSINDRLNLDGGQLNQGSGTLSLKNWVQTGGTFSGGVGATNVSGTYTQSGGAFTGGSGNIDINSHFTLSNGTFTSTSGLLTAARNWTHTAGGTFNANGGTVEFDGGNSTINVNTTETFNNLTIDTSGTKTISSGDRLIVQNTLNLEDGKVNTGILEAQGNVDVESQYTGGTAPLHFTGSNSQTFDLTGAEAKFDGHITVNKTSGTATLASDLTMNKSGQDLYIQSGTFNLANNSVLVNDRLNLDGGVLAHGTGSLTTKIWDQTAGNFNGGTGLVDVNQDYLLSGGTFQSTQGYLRVARHWTHTTGGTFNANGGTVEFDGGNSTINVNTTETFNNLTIDTSGTKTISSGDRLIVQNTLNLEDGKVNTGILEAQGNVDVESQYTGGTAPLHFTGSNSQTFDLTGATGKFNADIKVNKSSGAVVLASTLDMNAGGQDLTIEEGTLDLNGQNLLVRGSSSKWIIEDGGVVRLEGGESITTKAGYPQFNSGSRVIYDGSGNYTSLKLGNTYHHLNFEGLGSWLHSSTLNIAGDLSIASGALKSSGQDINASGDWTNTGQYVSGSNSVTFKGSGDSVVSMGGVGSGKSFHNVVINKTGSADVDVQGALDVNGNLSIQNGDFLSTTDTLFVSGDMNHTGGQFVHRSGTLTLDGTSQLLSGGFNLFNLTKSVSAADTLTIDSGALNQVTVAGNLALQGSIAGNLTIASAAPGNAVILDPQGTLDINFVDVSDNSNINAQTIFCAPGCNDLGNNTNWTFDFEPLPPIPDVFFIEGASGQIAAFDQPDLRPTIVDKDTSRSFQVPRLREGLLGIMRGNQG